MQHKEGTDARAVVRSQREEGRKQRLVLLLLLNALCPSPSCVCGVVTALPKCDRSRGSGHALLQTEGWQTGGGEETGDNPKVQKARDQTQTGKTATDSDLSCAE